jgi:hypothetical protein
MSTLRQAEAQHPTDPDFAVVDLLLIRWPTAPGLTFWASHSTGFIGGDGTEWEPVEFRVVPAPLGESLAGEFSVRFPYQATVAQRMRDAGEDTIKQPPRASWYQVLAGDVGSFARSGAESVQGELTNVQISREEIQATFVALGNKPAGRVYSLGEFPELEAWDVAQDGGGYVPPTSEPDP